MGQQITDNEAKLQQYMATSIGDVVNDLGGFVQFTITNAFNAGYQAGFSAANSNVLPACQVIEYQRKSDTTLYVRKSDGRYYVASTDFMDMVSPTGWDKTNFDVSEYSITQVLNKRGVVLSVNKQVTYDDKQVVIKSFVEKADDKILASVQIPNVEKLKIVDVNELY